MSALPLIQEKESVSVPVVVEFLIDPQELQSRG